MTCSRLLYIPLPRALPLIQPLSLQDNTVEEAHDSAKRAKTRPQDVFEPLVDNSNTPFSPDFRHLEGVATDLGPESQPEPAHHSSAAEAGTGSALRAKLARYAAQLDTDSSSSAKATCGPHLNIDLLFILLAIKNGQA